MKRFGLAILLCTSCDIFHSTDLPTKCSDGGCTEASAMDAGVVPFTTDSAKAFQYAQQACAWLAACESPMGHNQTGTCLADAILAYDQTINPNRQPKGDARTFWQCLFNAAASQSCAAVVACVYPKSPMGAACGGMFVGCAAMSAGTRIDCRGALPNVPAPAEACVAQGKTCTAVGMNTNALCTGPQGQTCVPSNCTMGYLFSYCPDGGTDLGQDCSNVGAALCVNIPDGGSGCKPETTGTCTPSVNVTCDDAGVAHGCPTGFQETIACKKFTPDCNEGAYPYPQLPSDACHAAAPSCTTDACGAGNVIACLRGKSVTIDCMGLGLTACTTVQTSTEGPLPACGKPTPRDN